MDIATRVVTIGASAGGVEALTQFVADLPVDLDAAVLVVLHVAPDLPSYLPRILERSGRLPCVHATDGLELRPGRIIIAPPDRHMAVDKEHIRVWRGSRENRQRPSIDVLFRSAALAYGARVTGVILSGALDDGVAGMDAITRAGGQALVQDPDEARHPYLPRNVLHTVSRAQGLPMEALVERLKSLVGGEGGKDIGIGFSPSLETDRLEQEITRRMGTQEEMSQLGALSGLTCPECNGALTTVAGVPQLRYRCHTGHGYTAQTLFKDQTEQVERLLWQTLRELRENAETVKALVEHAHHEHDPDRARHYEQHLRQVEHSIQHLYQLSSPASHASEVRKEL